MAAHAEFGIPYPTIRTWLRKARMGANVAAVNDAQRKRQERVLRSWTNTALQREDIAVRMAEEVHDLLDSLHAPMIEKIVKTINIGDGMSEVEIVTVHHDEPTVQAKKAIMVTAAIAIDKMQALTGNVGVETAEEVSEVERAERLANAVDELAARRETGAA